MILSQKSKIRKKCLAVSSEGILANFQVYAGGWSCMIMLLIYYVAGCRAFSVFSAEVFERALGVFKVINCSGNTCVGLYIDWTLCACVIVCYCNIMHACVKYSHHWHITVSWNWCISCCFNVLAAGVLVAVVEGFTAQFFPVAWLTV